MTLLYVVLIISIITCVLLFLAQIKVEIARRKGIYPQKGQATIDDVKRLITTGKSTLAIRAYREIHRVSLKKAKIEINKIKNLAIDSGQK